jgi:hypothetical protein
MVMPTVTIRQANATVILHVLILIATTAPVIRVKTSVTVLKTAAHRRLQKLTVPTERMKTAMAMPTAMILQANATVILPVIAWIKALYVLMTANAVTTSVAAENADSS